MKTIEYFYEKKEHFKFLFYEKKHYLEYLRTYYEKNRFILYHKLTEEEFLSFFACKHACEEEFPFVYIPNNYIPAENPDNWNYKFEILEEYFITNSLHGSVLNELKKKEEFQFVSLKNFNICSNINICDVLYSTYFNPIKVLPLNDKNFYLEKLLLIYIEFYTLRESEIEEIVDLLSKYKEKLNIKLKQVYLYDHNYKDKLRQETLITHENYKEYFTK